LAPALLAGLTVWRATEVGLGVTADSVQYLAAAESFWNGNGPMVPYGGPRPYWLAQFPPLFSLVLAVGGNEGLTWVRVLHTVLAMATTMLLFAAALRVSGSRLTAFAAAALLAGTTPFLLVHTAVISEPLFLALLVGGWAAWEFGQPRLAALALGLAAATRFAGLASAGLAAVRRREWQTAALAIGPVAGWLVLTAVLSGQATNRTVGFYAMGMGEPGLTGWATAGVLGALWAVGWRRGLAPMALGLATAQLAFLVFARHFLDAAILFEDRHLLPVWILVLGAGAALLPARGFAAGAVCCAALFWRPLPENRLDLNAEAIRRSATLAYVKGLAPEVGVITPAPDLIYFHLRRRTRWIPARSGYFDHRPRPDWCEVLQNIASAQAETALVFFDALKGRESYLAGVRDVPGCLAGLLPERTADGTVFRVKNVPELEGTGTAR